MKKFLSILLSAVMIISIFPVSSFAVSDRFAVPYSIVDGVTDIFYAVKNIFDSVIGFIGGDKIVDVDKYREKPFEVPGLDDGFIPQGLCYVEALSSFAISGYMENDAEGNKQNSRIYLVNPDTNESRMFIIDGYTGHAGGIASSGNDLWISSGGSASSDGKIYHFSTDLFKTENGAKIKYDGYFSVPVKGSVLYCDDNKLWVCEFYNNDKDSNKVNKEHHYGSNHAWACGYNLPVDVDYSAKEKLTPDVVLSVPDKVQGMAITDDSEVVFSTSYGRRNNSKLHVFEPYSEWKSDTVNVYGTEIPIYIAKRKTRITRFKMPTLMEGLDYNDGKLYIVFESGAKTYSDAKEINKSVWETDIDSIIG